MFLHKQKKGKDKLGEDTIHISLDNDTHVKSVALITHKKRYKLGGWEIDRDYKKPIYWLPLSFFDKIYVCV